MNILYICPYIPCSGINAGCNRMFELIKRLASRNTVSLVSFMAPEEEKFLPELKRVCKRVDVVKKDYPWRANALSILPPMIDEFSYKPMKDLIKNRLDEEYFDILHFEYLIMAQYVPDNSCSVKFLTEHELHYLAQLREIRLEESFLGKLQMWGSAIKKKIYEMRICNRFDRVITMTDKEASILRSCSPRLHVAPLPMGVDHDFFSPSKGTEEDIDIIFVGFFGHPPNVDAVHYFYKDIFPLIRKKSPNVNFTIVGFSPPDSILALERDKNVTVTGYVKDIRPYLARSKVFVMPVRSGAGMRGKLFEAWGMGKAVVSTPVGCDGTGAIDGESASIAGNPHDFASRVIELMLDERKRARLGNNGRQLVEKKYNWDLLADQLGNLYKESLLV